MRRETWGVVSGLIVLAVGVISIVGLLRSDAVPAEPGVGQPATAAAAGSAVTPISSTPDLPGVPTRVARVLAWSGDTRFASDQELAQLPRSVSAVLTAYGLPLRIPLTEAGG